MYSIEIENPETGEVVDVEFSVSGGYARATLYSPAEYPEVEFVNLPDWADEYDVADQALELLADYAAEAKAEAQMAARGYDW